MLPSLAALHPQVVHFVIALLLVGVLLRLVAFLGPRLAWASPAATALLLLGTGAAVVAVRSGLDAHGPVERIPGARAAVVEHEEAGEWVRNIFLGVAALELVALALGDARRRRWAHIASAVVGVAGAAALVRAGDLGGDLTYRYAGGIGIRSGDPADVEHLLTAGLYNMSQVERQRGNGAGAATLVQELDRRNPGDPMVGVLRAESILRDQRDPRGALQRLDSVDRANAARPSPMVTNRAATLRADAYLAAGSRDSARAVLEALLQKQPQNARIRAKLDSIKG